MSAFPQKAKVVIIGLGGIVGASVAHHLVARGWSDIVGIDKSAVPTDIGSTAHASDFCYTASHDFLSCWTTLYSIEFYEKMRHYARVGGLEVARVGDDARMDEIKRKVMSAKAFGARARLIGPAEIKKKFPLLEQDKVQGGMWDPDAGLVIPRSQTVAGKLVDQAVAAGKLQVFANTPAKSLVIESGRIKGVVTDRGTIMAEYVVVCAGLWGRLIAEMAGEDLPVMPVDHPLTFFGPYTEFANTGKEIGWPLLRDQGNSAYMRDTGDPTTAEGGMIEWGYYEQKNPRLCHPRKILEKHEARLSPSQRDLEIEQILEPLERAIELTPTLREPYATGRNVKRSPFYEREKELGGYFMELGGWERAHGYAANEHLLKKYGNRVPVRENEWDNRHFWRVSNAEHLAMSEDCGIVNLSHFSMYDVECPDHVALLEWLCAAKIGGDNSIGKGIYTHFLDEEGMVRADFTVIRMADRCRVIDGADAGPRDFRYIARTAQDKGFDATVTDVTEKYVTIGLWGPNARDTLQKVVED